MKEAYKKDLEEILEGMKKYHPHYGPKVEQRVTKAFYFAHKAHEGQKRYSGEDYFTHPVEATKILLQIQPDTSTVQTCLLHDVIEDTPVTSEDIKQEFGKSVQFLCDGATKVAKVRIGKKTAEAEYINLQKLLVSVSNDIRVVFVKIADRIHNLSTLYHVPEHKQKRIAQESLKIYAPICDKLGLYYFKSQIEEYAFRYIYPDMYKIVNRDINEFKQKKELVLETARQQIKNLLQQKKINILSLDSRGKHSFSVYDKMRRKNYSSALDIFDLVGFRVIVADIDDCYKTLGAIHSRWHPLQGRFKDYIAVPKPNGYKSLHTTVLGLGDSRIPTEIQIKTEQMNIDAEYGPAAHWAYKLNKSSHFDEDYLEKARIFPDTIPKDSTDAKEFYKTVSEDLLKDRVIVFTPKGDIKNLTEGSTPVDFAYAIHSEVGGMCVGAVINGKIKPLDYKLKNGDVVNILTKTGKEPNLEWLHFVKSSNAKTNIQAYKNKLNKEAGFKIDTTKEKIEPTTPRKPSAKKDVLEEFPINKEDIVIGGNRHIPYKISVCCKPKIGNKIVAYKGRGLNYKIHRINCQELLELDPERCMDAYFCIRKRYEVKSRNKLGLLSEYIALMGKFTLNIVHTEVRVDSETNTSISTFILEGQSEQDFEFFEKEMAEVQQLIFITESGD